MSFYNNRPSYVQASWRARSLYPPNSIEPSFSNNQTSTLDSTLDSPPPPPPPLYFRGEQHRNNSIDQSNTTTSHQLSLESSEREIVRSSYYPTSTKSLATTTILFSYHPSVLNNNNNTWKSSLNRPLIWWRCIAGKNGKGEQLSQLWPKEFGGGTTWRSTIDFDGVQELSTRDSRGRDSGFGRISTDEESYDPVRYSTSSNARPISAISLSPSLTNQSQTSNIHPTISLPQSSTALPIHPLSFEYLKKLEIITNLLHRHLIKTRIILSILEASLWLIGILLIVAIAYNKGQQGIFIEAVELTIVLWIIFSGIGIGLVRMNRTSLNRSLRSLARDWNPLPLSTNSALSGLGNNHSHYLSPDPPSSTVVDEEATLEATEARRKDIEESKKPKLRWNFHFWEGWFLCYRPVVKVELFTPSSFNFRGMNELERVVTSRSNGSSRVPVPVVEMEVLTESGSSREVEEGGAEVPPYTPV